MQILLSSDQQNGIEDVQSWLHFNEIKFVKCEFFDAQNCEYRLPDCAEHSVIVCPFGLLHDLYEMRKPQQIEAIRSCCEKGNQLWFIGTDLASELATTPALVRIAKQLDAVVPAGGVVFFLDADPTDRCYLVRLQNIRIVPLGINMFDRGLPRCQAASNTKIAATHDFLLTMFHKPGRPHRTVLSQQLEQRPDLVKRGLISCNKKFQKDMYDWSADPGINLKWMGRPAPSPVLWNDGHASMDLYLDCWLEIVPETMYRDLFYFTEKTQKPIMTRTPFLMVTTAHYLDFLRQRGFKTFGSLIDESYDRHHHIQDRVRGLLDVLEDIMKNGTQKFYQASQPILDHNFNRLCEIAGSWWYKFDQRMWRALEDFESYHNSGGRA